MSSKILNYVDNVVSNYELTDGGLARYPNLDITQTATIEEADVVTGKIKTLTVGEDLTNGKYGYSFPVENPSDGDYLAYNGTAFEFRNFSTESIELRNLIGFEFDSEINGSIAHVINNDTLVVNPTTESLIIDGKSSVLTSQLKLTDRLMISVDLPGSGTTLLKMTLRDLFTFIEDNSTSVSSIKNLVSNTTVDVGVTDVVFTVDNGTYDQISILNTDGLMLNGTTLEFKSPLESTANASIETINEGFLFSRFNNTIDLRFDDTQNIIVKTDELQLGTSLYINNSTLTVSADALIDQDVSSNSNTAFHTLQINSDENTISVGTGALVVANGGASIAQDLYVGNTVFASLHSVTASSGQLKTNIRKLTKGLDLIMGINPVKYNRLNDGIKNEFGFIAEEIETILPNVVQSNNQFKGIAYTQIIPVLVSALQEQQLKINELETKINS